MNHELKKNIKASLIIGILLFLGGGWMFGKMTLFDSFRAISAKSWPTTTGRVVSSSLKKTGKPGKSVIEYVPVVRYEYTVEGVKHQSDQLHFGKQATDKTAAESKIAKYPVGQEVKVHYSPSNPAKASLQTNFKFNIFVPPVGIAMMIAGFISIRFAFREMRKAR